MQDVIHGLAQSVSSEICLKWENTQFDVSERTRHSSFFLGRSKPTNFQALYKAKRLRTFFLQRAFMFHSLPESLYLKDMFQAFRCLRVLCFNQVSLADLPESIGSLKHLRLLDISRTWITRLPASVNNIHNLQTLVLSECPNFHSLPNDIGNLINLRHLFLPTNSQLEEMPKGIRRLTCLQTLPIFVVDKRRSGIQDLRNLQHLRGSLCISKINNVRDALDAKEANLEQKQQLQELELRWDDEENANFDGHLQEKVLQCLQPSQKLKKLTIRSYAGRMLPTWMRHSSLPNLIVLSLHSCTRTKILPPLGQLPLLRHLNLKNLQSIKQIGEEFAMGGFPALETLHFENMPEWEEWLAEDGSEFCHLKSFQIKHCSKVRTFVNRFPNLVTLEIQWCKELRALPRFESQGEEFPCLHELKVGYYPKHKELPQLLPALVKMDKMELYECEELTVPPMLPSLNCLSIQGLHGIQRPFTDLDAELNSLHELTIWNCSNLLQLPHSLPSLVKMDIHNCKQLAGIPGFPVPQNFEAEGNVYPSLHVLVIKNCAKLKGLKGNFPSLLELEIKKCNALAALPRLPSLCKLDIDECGEMLQHPFHGLKSVSRMCISKIPKFLCLPETLLKRLEELKIANCDELVSLWAEDGQDYFTSLQHIEIWCCSKFISLPNRIPTTLESLKLIYCCSLELLPQSLHLSSLKDLEVSINEQLVSFPEEGLPLTLTNLVIKECQSLKEMPGGLHKLTCLQLLDIGNCPCLEYFPDEGLPVSVKWVSISGCKNLKHLPNKMRNLISLMELHISNVPKLAMLPEDGLPATLQYLGIEGCPLLTVRCQRADGEEWPKIAHILDKRIDGKVV